MKLGMDDVWHDPQSRLVTETVTLALGLPH